MGKPLTTISSLARTVLAPLFARLSASTRKNGPRSRAVSTPMYAPKMQYGWALSTIPRTVLCNTGAVKKESGTKLCYRLATVAACYHITASFPVHKEIIPTTHGVEKTSRWMSFWHHIQNWIAKCSAIYLSERIFNRGVYGCSKSILWLEIFPPSNQ